MSTAVEFEENSKSLGEYLAILKRQKDKAMVTAIITLVVVVLIALIWPPTYRSAATILIEEQEIPRDLVQSTITSYANQQIQIISQRSMTLKNIMTLVDKYELYDEAELRRMPKTEIALDFQENINLDIVSAEIMDPRSGRPTQATIAFTLSYDHESPIKAQQVMNELVSLYLNENLRSRTEKSAGAADFLRSESISLGQTLEKLEDSLARFKEENEGSLPELYQYNLSIIDRTERELLESSLRLKELEKRELQLEAELTRLSPYAPTVLASGESVLSDYDRLKSLESEYRRKAAVYSDSHPDLTRLRREVVELKSTLGKAIDPQEQAKLLQTERDKLSELRDKYTTNHPQIISQQKIVEQIEAQQQGLGVSPQLVGNVAPDNPAYVLLDTQLKSTRVEMTMLKEKSVQFRNKIGKFEKQILKAPSVEKNYSAMRRDYDNAQLKYREIKAKLMSAELAQNLEQGRKGERFTLIQPPVQPEEPVSPNRFAILLIGLVLSVVAGISVAIIVETLDRGIRGERQLFEVIGAPPLVSVPYLYLETEVESVDRRKYYIIAAAIVASIVVLFSLHSFYKPLDVIYFILLRKLGI